MSANYGFCVNNNFEQLVEEKIKKLSNLSIRELELEVAQERISWVKQRNKQWQEKKKLNARMAFELFFFEFLGIKEDKIPVLKETGDEIIFASANQCDTLDACLQLGLDTRDVCKGAYEKSTQAFFSQLDPQIRFLRSYQKIRPFFPYCQERIVVLNFEKYMKMAIEEANISKKEGNSGYGALIVMGKEILAKTHDTVITENDPSCHGEVNAIRQAVKKIKTRDLSGAILFSTCEPCPMCSSLAVWSNLTTIVYGASIRDTQVRGHSRIGISAREISENAPVMLEVVGGVLKNRCLKLYE